MDSNCYVWFLLIIVHWHHSQPVFFFGGTLDKLYSIYLMCYWERLVGTTWELEEPFENLMRTWQELDGNMMGILFLKLFKKIGFLSILLIWQNFGFLWSFTAKIGHLGYWVSGIFCGFLGSYSKIKCHGRLGWYIAFVRTISIKYKPYLLD